MPAVESLHLRPSLRTASVSEGKLEEQRMDLKKQHLPAVGEAQTGTLAPVLHLCQPGLNYPAPY